MQSICRLKEIEWVLSWTSAKHPGVRQRGRAVNKGLLLGDVFSTLNIQKCIYRSSLSLFSISVAVYNQFLSHYHRFHQQQTHWPQKNCSTSRESDEEVDTTFTCRREAGRMVFLLLLGQEVLLTAGSRLSYRINLAVTDPECRLFLIPLYSVVMW